jgi:hypothetical protein
MTRNRFFSSVSVFAAILSGVAIFIPLQSPAASKGSRPSPTISRPPPPAAAHPATQPAPLPDPQVTSLKAVCASGQHITATVTVANTTGVPTVKESKIEVTVIARKVKPSKSPTTIWEDVYIVLGSRMIAAGFVGPETFVIDKAAPYFGNPKYAVRAKVLVPEKEKSAANNSKGTSLICNW